MNGLYHCVCHYGYDIIVSKADPYQSDMESLQILGAQYIRYLTLEYVFT